MDTLFGNDPWPYGLDANRHTLDTFMRYLVDQHFLASPVPVDTLFAPIVIWSE